MKKEREKVTEIENNGKKQNKERQKVTWEKN